MMHMRIRAHISLFVLSQNPMSIRHAMSDRVSPRVICFSQYLRDNKNTMRHMSVLVARVPYHQISSPFCTCIINAIPVSIVHGSHEKAWGLIFHLNISGM